MAAHPLLNQLVIQADTKTKSLEAKLGPYFAIDVNYVVVSPDDEKNSTSSNSTDLRSRIINTEDLNTLFTDWKLDDFAKPDKNASGFARRGRQMECFLKGMVGFGFLELEDYFWVERDLKARVFSNKSGETDPKESDDENKSNKKEDKDGSDGGAYLAQRHAALDRLWELYKDEIIKIADSSESDECSLEMVPNFRSFYDAHLDSCLNFVRESKDNWRTIGWEKASDILAPIEKRDDPSETTLKSRSDVKVWQPFSSDGECCKYLFDLGFKTVFHEADVDFFKKVHDEDFMSQVDFVFDNPPYTTLDMKKRVLKSLYKKRKPFCLLFPVSILHGELLHTVFGEEGIEGIQIIIQRRILAAPLRSENGVLLAGKAVPCKGLVWLCWGMELEKDVYFV